MKKDLNALIEQALDNIKNDRQTTDILLSQLQEYMAVPGNQDRYSDSGPIAAKFVETLQRSNEQLVKLAALVHKKEAHRSNDGLSESDKAELFDMIKDK